MTNILQLRHPRVIVKRQDSDWMVRVIEAGHVSEHRYDNFSCAQRVANVFRRRLKHRDEGFVDIGLTSRSRPA